MKEQKYKIGEKVWLMNNNKISEIMVTGVLKLSYGEYGEDRMWNPFYYAFRTTEGLTDFKESKWFHEENIFPTKEELIKTL